MIDSPVALLAILAVLTAVPLLLRRYRASAPDAVRVVGRTALAKGAVVAVVAVGERRMLVSAGDKGVQLLTELDAAPETTGAAAGARAAPDRGTTGTSLDRMDVVGTDASTSTTPAPDALGALATLEAPTIPRPGIGLVDRLRAMTVRTPVKGRPSHVPFRR